MFCPLLTAPSIYALVLPLAVASARLAPTLTPNPAEKLSVSAMASLLARDVIMISLPALRSAPSHT